MSKKGVKTPLFMKDGGFVGRRGGGRKGKGKGKKGEGKN